MKISITDKDTTIIEFTRAELEGCRLTYENLARDRVKSRSVLLTIINETASISGYRSPVDSNTTMDILPDGEGGCVIILKAALPEKGESFGIFLSESFDNVIDLYRSFGEVLSDRADVYHSDGMWYTLVRGERALIKICGEFMEFLSSDEADRLRLEEFAERKGSLKEIFGGTASEK